MLGALGMTIDDCITEYLQLAPKIFEEGLLARQKPSLFFRKLQAKSRFDASALENEIKRLVQSYCQVDPDLPLEETLALANSCRITVCSTHLNVTKPTQYQGLEDIGLEEWREFQTLTEATDAYLKTHRRDVDSCVEAFLGLIVDSVKKPPQGLLLSEFPLKTDQFFGRAAELSQISDCLEDASSTQKRVAIHGLPGSGKTQLAALEYAMKTREHFHGCLWINAESRMSIEQSFVTFVGTICSKYPPFRELANHLEPFDVVRAWLQTPAHYPWLMVIDGLDDLVCGKRLIQYCMGLIGGTFCVTSTHHRSP